MTSCAIVAPVHHACLQNNQQLNDIEKTASQLCLLAVTITVL